MHKISTGMSTDMWHDYPVSLLLCLVLNNRNDHTYKYALICIDLLLSS